MAGDGSNDQTQRAVNEVVARLHALGVNVSERESSVDLVELLNAVENFGVAVENHGGDLMVDEPVGSSPAAEPDHPAFVLPVREADESIRAYIGRIEIAQHRAMHSRPRRT